MITDNSGAFGDSETDLRIGNAISYAVSVGNLSLQADVIMNKDKVTKDVVQTKAFYSDAGFEPLGGRYGKTVEELRNDFGFSFDFSFEDFIYDRDLDVHIVELGTVTKKTVDSYQFGVTLDNIMGSGKLAFAHKRHETTRLKGNKKSSNFIAAEYSVGSMTLHFGLAQHREIMGNFCLSDPFDADSRVRQQYWDTPPLGSRLPGCIDGKKIQTTVFTGVRGSVGDSGVKYVIQIRTKKTSGNRVDILDPRSTPPSTKPFTWSPGESSLRGQALPADKHSPWIFGLSRSLGGGASVHFEYGNKDRDREDNQSALWLQVDF